MPAIARAYVEIVPDAKRFPDLVAQAIRAIKDPVITPTADLTKIRADLQEATKTLTAEIDPELVDVEKVRGELADLTKPETVAIDAVAEVRKAAADISALTKPDTKTVDVYAEVAKARTDIDGLLKTETKSIDVIAEVAKARADLDSLLKTETKTIDVRYNDPGTDATSSASSTSGGGGSGSTSGLVGKAIGAAGIGATLSEIVGITGNLDVYLAELGTRLDLTKDQVKQFSGLFQQLGADVDLGAVSMNDAAEAALVFSRNAVGSAGDIQSLLRPTLQLAIVAKESAADAADQVSIIAKTLKVPAQDVQKVVEQLGAAAKQGGNVAQLASAIGNAGGAYAALFKDKAPIERTADLATAFTLLSQAGLRGEEAGTALNRALLDMSHPTDKAKDAIKHLTDAAKENGEIFKGQGDIIHTASGEIRPLEDIFKSLQSVQDSGKVTNTDYLASLNEIFGTFGSQAVSRLANQADAWDKVNQKVHETGVTTALATAQAAGYKGAIAAIGGAAETLAAQVGGALKGTLLPALQGVASIVSEVSGALNVFNNLRSQGVGSLDALGAAFHRLLFTTQKFGRDVVETRTTLGKVFEFLDGHWKEAAGAVAALGAAWVASMIPAAAATIAAVAPVLAIAAAIAAAGAAAVYAYEHFDGFRAAVDGIVQFVTSIDFAAIGQKVLSIVPDNFVEKAQQILGSVAGAFTSGLEAVRAIVETAVTVIQDLWDRFGHTLIDRARGYLDGVMQIINGEFTLIKGVFDVFAAIFTGDWSKLWEGVKEICRGAWSIISGVIDTAVASIQAVIGVALGAISAAWSLGWHALHTLVVDVWGLIETAVKAGIAPVQPLIETATKAFGTAFTTFKDVAVGAINAIKGPIDAVVGWVGSAARAVQGLIDLIAKVKAPNLTPWANGSIANLPNGGKAPGTNAMGGVFDRATLGWFGEAGVEAILPLTRPKRLQELLADSRVSSPILQALAANGQQSQRTAAQPMSMQPIQVVVPTAEHALIYARAHAAELFQRARSSGALA